MPLFGDVDFQVTMWLTTVRTPALDALAHFILGSDLRIGFLAVLLFFVWVEPVGSVRGNERRILLSTSALVAAMTTSFVLRHVTWKQDRPNVFMGWLEFPPLGDLGTLNEFRSFPSDTATLAAAVTTVVFVYSRRAGMLAIAWTVVAVSLPRIYAGYHYLSDIVVGLAVGSIVAYAVVTTRQPLARWTALMATQHAARPATVLVLTVLLAHQVGTMFPLLQWLGGMARQFIPTLNASDALS